MLLVVLALANINSSAKAEATSFFYKLYFSYILTNLGLFIISNLSGF
jgi:hypothetical protein